MTDIAVLLDGPGFDINYNLGDFETDEGLETAVLISLFTDRRVAKEELPEGETDRRGHWGDLFSEVPGDLTGSKLWLLGRGKVSDETRNLAEEYCAEALEWMIEDGVASTVDVVAQIASREMITIEISITRPKKRDVFFWRYQLVWESQSLKARRA